MEPPSHDDIVMALNALIWGSRTRQEVSRWAVSFIVGEMRTNDKWINRILSNLAMADGIGFDRPYFYDEDNFRDWLREFEQGGVK